MHKHRKNITLDTDNFRAEHFFECFKRVHSGKATSSRKHVRVMYTPLNPAFNSKTGVCRSIPIFLIFAPKHRLWVLFRTASPRRL